MKQLIEIQDKSPQPKDDKAPVVQKQYRKPLLQLLGDLRSLTLSGSPGVLDSDLSSGNPGEI